MRRKGGFQMKKVTATVSERWSKTRWTPGTTRFPAEADLGEKRVAEGDQGIGYPGPPTLIGPC